MHLVYTLVKLKECSVSAADRFWVAVLFKETGTIILQ